VKDLNVTVCTLFRKPGRVVGDTLRFFALLRMTVVARWYSPSVIACALTAVGCGDILRLSGDFSKGRVIPDELR
jgi:hypothetical protein